MTTTERRRPLEKDFPGADARDDALLRHVVFVGTLWFCGAIVASAVLVGGLLGSGWRPRDLALGLELLWWLGSGVAALGVLGLAWSGCPVVTADAASAAQRKSVTIRLGVALFLLGAAAVSLVAMLG